VVTAGPVLLYDGVCGLCTRLVQWVLRVDRRGGLRFAPLQGELAQAVRLRHPEMDGADTMVWLEPPDDRGPERLLLRSDAVLRLWTYLRGPWGMLAALSSRVPRRLRDRLYDQVARRRMRWFGTAESCELPSPEQRARMLE
jgi:predicted DCC family thiol-disulfide oxidoreductase YuxK